MLPKQIASAIESQIKAAGVVLPACSTSIGSSEQVATSGDFLVRHAKDLLVAAAASVLLGSDNQPIGGSKHYGCNLAECLLLRTANKPPTAAAAAPLSVWISVFCLVGFSGAAFLYSSVFFFVRHVCVWLIADSNGSMCVCSFS